MLKNPGLFLCPSCGRVSSVAYATVAETNRYKVGFDDGTTEWKLDDSYDFEIIEAEILHEDNKACVIDEHPDDVAIFVIKVGDEEERYYTCHFLEAPRNANEFIRDIIGISDYSEKESRKIIHDYIARQIEEYRNKKKEITEENA